MPLCELVNQNERQSFQIVFIYFIGVVILFLAQLQRIFKYLLHFCILIFYFKFTYQKTAHPFQTDTLLFK